MEGFAMAMTVLGAGTFAYALTKVLVWVDRRK